MAGAYGWRLGKVLIALASIFLLLSALAMGTIPIVFLIGWQTSPPNLHVTKPLHFDFRSNAPEAELWLHSPDTMKKLNRENSGRASWWGPRLVPRGQDFSVKVMFVLPESEHNRGLGMFQLTTESLSMDKKVLAQNSIPCALKWRNQFVRLTRSFIFAIPLILGLLEDNQRIEMMALKATEEEIPMAGLRFFLHSKGGIPAAEGLPEIYASQVTVKSLGGGWIISWRIIWLSWLFVGLLVLEMSMLWFCCGGFIIPLLSSDQTPEASWKDAGTSGTESAMTKRKEGKVGDDSLLELSDLEEEEYEKNGGDLSSNLRRRVPQASKGESASE